MKNEDSQVVSWKYGWLSMTSGHGPRGFDIMGAVMGIAVIGVYGVPLGIMVKCLRGDKVNIGNAEPIVPADG